MTAHDAFVKYLLETFEEVYDPNSIDHLTKEAIFVAGWEALFQGLLAKKRSV
jgi:hypothetical protein